MDYDDVLQQKRREENSYRNGDAFVGGGGGGGGMRGSTSEGALAGGRGGGLVRGFWKIIPDYMGDNFKISLSQDDSFSLGNGLSELTGAVRRRPLLLPHSLI